MQIPVRFHPEAEFEFSESVTWYNKKQTGLGLEFARCVDEAIERIRKSPDLFPIAFNNYRKIVVKRFPYIILFEYWENQILVLAVYHTKRNPQKVLKRN